MVVKGLVQNLGKVYAYLGVEVSEYLTFTSLLTNSADDKLLRFFLFFPEKMIWHFMQIVKTCFLGKVRKQFQFVVCWKFYPECWICKCSFQKTWKLSVSISIIYTILSLSCLPWVCGHTKCSRRSWPFMSNICQQRKLIISMHMHPVSICIHWFCKWTMRALIRMGEYAGILGLSLGKHAY